MFGLRKSNNHINKIHERSLRIVTIDNNNNFEDLLKSNNQITVHQTNLQVLITKVFKIINGLSSPIVDNVLIFHENTHNIGNFQIISNDLRSVMVNKL